MQCRSLLVKAAIVKKQGKDILAPGKKETKIVVFLGVPEIWEGSCVQKTDVFKPMGDPNLLRESQWTSLLLIQKEQVKLLESLIARESKLETVAGNPGAPTHTQSSVFEIHEDLLSLVYAGADHHVSFPTSWMRSSSFFRKQTMPDSSTHPAALPAVLHFARQP